VVMEYVYFKIECSEGNSNQHQGIINQFKLQIQTIRAKTMKFEWKNHNRLNSIQLNVP
jgi:hypothetical protein